MPEGYLRRAQLERAYEKSATLRKLRRATYGAIGFATFCLASAFVIVLVSAWLGGDDGIGRWLSYAPLGMIGAALLFAIMAIVTQNAAAKIESQYAKKPPGKDLLGGDGPMVIH